MIYLTDADFYETIAANNLVLVDFYADWCGPCRMMEPILEDFASDNQDIIVAKVDVDENRILVEDLGVQSMPTLLLFKDGWEVNRVSGAMGRTQLDAFVVAHELPFVGVDNRT